MFNYANFSCEGGGWQRDRNKPAYHRMYCGMVVGGGVEIVSFVSAPSYHLCQHLNKGFHSFTSFLPRYTVSNSCDLVDKITNFAIPPNCILVSFDVDSLYTNVPIKPTLTRISEILEQCKIPPPLADEFVSLLKVCLEPNICQFNNKVYKFADGLPMGSPIASLMANIFMDSLETVSYTHLTLPTIYSV